jgi:tRNA A-37 threonylcarbamoyl transferase component Bud32
MQQEMDLISLGKLLLQFAVLPIAAFAWAHYKQTQAMAVEIAVIKTEFLLTKENHDRELKEIKDGFTNVLKKLDEIQRDMRK